MRRLGIVISVVVLAVAGCSLFPINVRTDPTRFEIPVLGQTTPIGTLTVYAEKYVPLNDVPEEKKLVKFKEVKVSWEDSANLDVDYELCFSTRGEVAKDPDSIKLYLEIKCNPGMEAQCNTYYSFAIAQGYSTDTVDMSFRQMLLKGRTTGGKVNSYEEYLGNDAVSLLDSVVEQRGMFVLVKSTLLVPSFTDTVRIRNFIMDIKAEFK